MSAASKISPQEVHNTLDRWILTDGYPLVCDLQKSHGPYLHDARTGTDYLDFFGFFASRPVGFNHPQLDNPEFIEKIGRVALHKTSNCDLYTVEYATFVDAFGSVPCGNAFKHLFFIEGGGAAVGNAVKTAIDWKFRKNMAAGRGERGSQILHFKQAFHGRTGYAISLTDSYDARKGAFYPKFDWPRVTNPTMPYPFDDAAKATVEELEAQAVKEINDAIDAGEHDVAAILIEPIQGEGGDNYFRSEFLAKLRAIADEREVLLIFDEIQTGFGGTGRWWDWQHHGVQPDIMTFGKKTQVCGFAGTDRLDEVEKGVFAESSRISSTFEGNLVDMVRCTKVIEIIEADGLIANAESMGKYALKVLAELAETFEEMRGLRGRGLWTAFDLESTELRDAYIQAAFEEELLLIPSGTHTVRMRPALDVSADAIGRAGAQMEAAFVRLRKGR